MLCIIPVTNIAECNWDGGDCCKENVKKGNCVKCACLEDSRSAPKTIVSTSSIGVSTSPTPEGCRNKTWAIAGNGYCEDGKIFYNFLIDTFASVNYSFKKPTLSYVIGMEEIVVVKML